MAKKKSSSITFRFDDSPSSQANANALISALSGKPFPGPQTPAPKPTIGTGSGD